MCIIGARRAGGAVIGWRLQFDANAASWGGGCQRAGRSTAGRATRWASSSSGRVGLPHARIVIPAPRVCIRGQELD